MQVSANNLTHSEAENGDATIRAGAVIGTNIQ